MSASSSGSPLSRPPRRAPRSAGAGDLDVDLGPESRCAACMSHVACACMDHGWVRRSHARQSLKITRHPSLKHARSRERRLPAPTAPGESNDTHNQRTVWIHRRGAGRSLADDDVDDAAGDVDELLELLAAHPLVHLVRVRVRVRVGVGVGVGVRGRGSCAPPPSRRRPP